jgi:hypothetical protein
MLHVVTAHTVRAAEVFIFEDSAEESMRRVVLNFLSSGPFLTTKINDADNTTM